MSTSNFPKVFVRLLLLQFENHHPVGENQFAYKPGTSCIEAKTVLKEIIMYYNSKRSDVYCSVVDLSKAYHRINTSLFCNRSWYTGKGHCSYRNNGEKRFCLYISWSAVEW